MGSNFKEIYFHGTQKKRLKKLLSEGLKSRYGRATFTESLKYAAIYSGKDNKEIIKSGIFAVFQNKCIKPALESDIILNKKEKIITGWPNRWRNKQYGYFPKSKK